MTSKEIRELAPAEITTKLRETREQLLQLRLRKNSGQVEKPHLLREYRNHHDQREGKNDRKPVGNRPHVTPPLASCQNRVCKDQLRNWPSLLTIVRSTKRDPLWLSPL